MHFILLVYKYEYIMNKNSSFVNIFDIVWYFPACTFSKNGQKILVRCDVMSSQMKKFEICVELHLNVTNVPKFNIN